MADVTIGYLPKAKRVGDLVRGTSGTSVYVVVLLSPRLNVAARITDSKLSVRVVGPEPPAQVLTDDETVELLALGFTVVSSHASLHVTLNKPRALDMLAATLMGILQLTFVNASETKYAPLHRLPELLLNKGV